MAASSPPLSALGRPGVGPPTSRSASAATASPLLTMPFARVVLLFGHAPVARVVASERLLARLVGLLELGDPHARSHRFADRPLRRPLQPRHHPVSVIRSSGPAHLKPFLRPGLRPPFGSGLTTLRAPPGPDTLDAQVRCTAAADRHEELSAAVRAAPTIRLHRPRPFGVASLLQDAWPLCDRHLRLRGGNSMGNLRASTS
jgi:hypothetical protein